MPSPFPAVPLPELVLADQLPAAAVVAVPTAPEGESARLAGQLPEGLGVDAAALLARETAKGGPGEVVGVPVTVEGDLERVLLVGTGAATPADLRKAGAALRALARQQRRDVEREAGGQLADQPGRLPLRDGRHGDDRRRREPVREDQLRQRHGREGGRHARRGRPGARPRGP